MASASSSLYLLENVARTVARNPLERAERIVHRRRFISAVDHAIGALGIARLGAVLVPLGLAHQLFEGVGVAVLQQVARLLPAEELKVGMPHGVQG